LDIGVVLPAVPGQPARYPGALSDGATMTGAGEFVFIVSKIHMAGEHELLRVVHAKNAFGFVLGFAQGG